MITSPSSLGAASVTSWPRSSRSRAAERTASTQSGSIAVSIAGVEVQPMRSRPGGRPTSSRNGRSGGGAKKGSPGSGTAAMSSSTALSRTLRLMAWRIARLPIDSPPGALETRPRDGLNPNTPQHDAGIRSEPAPSPPLATDVSPAAIAAADAPEEPPVVRSSAHGFRVGPNSTGSVVEWFPNSGVLVRPTITRPASR